MTDRDGGYGDLTPPNLEQPPAYIEGMGGGPAFPVMAPKMSQAEKDGHEANSEAFAATAALYAWMASIAPLMGPEGAPLSGVFATVALGAGLMALYEAELADDPPQPNYARPVVFNQRVSNPPQTSVPALKPLRVVIQQSVFGAVTAKGYLDSLERLQGAQQANDLRWSTVHLGVANLARRQLIVDLANNGAAINAAAKALKGSRYDLEFKPESASAKRWIGTSGVQAALTTHAQASGFIPAEIKRAIAFFKSDPTYSGPPALVSTHLAETAAKIYAAATKLAKLV